MNFRPLSQLIHESVVPWTALDWPVDWAAVFGRPAPTALEIGFGNGDFLVRLARERPDWNLVGVEISWGSLQRVLQRVDENQLRHVRILQGDGAFILDRCFPDAGLDEVFVNFSDPWRKPRHHGRRLVQAPFLRSLAHRLKVGGRVTIATDHPDYAAWILRALRGQDLLAPCDDQPVRHVLPGRIPTRYESKALGQGIPIHYYVWTKNRETPPTAVSDEVDAMPHVILEGPVDFAEPITQPLPLVHETVHRGLEVVLKLTRVYREQDAQSWLIDTLVKEGPLSQQFGMLVTTREEGGLLVKLSPLGMPRPTWAVKRAVAFVARQVLDSHPELRLEFSTVGGLDPTRPTGVSPRP